MKRHSPWLIFWLVAVAQFMVILDVAITNVALPAIKQEMGFSTSSLQWVVTAYALCFGGFLLLGGRAADLFGRRRVLLAGMAGFTLFSLLIGLSHSGTQLVALRALQGISAAFMSPAALSMVLVTFKDGTTRGKALGFWSLIAAGGAAIGMILGGILTQYFGWRWNFLVNVPTGIVMLTLISRFVPLHAREEHSMGLDIPGAVLVTSSLMAQVYAFSQAPMWGWLDPRTVITLVVAAVLLAGFIINEHVAKHPLMPLSIFRIRNITGANIIMAPIGATIMGTFYMASLYLQGVLHFTPLQAGVSFLPFPVVLGFVSTRIPKLVARFGFKRFLVAGPLIATGSAIWLSHLSANGNYWVNVFPALVIGAFGLGMTMMPTIAAATSGVPAHESGLASGLISTSQQMGGALGLSVVSGIAASATAAHVSLGMLAASVHGYHVAYLASISFTIISALASMLVIRHNGGTAVAAK